MQYSQIEGARGQEAALEAFFFLMKLDSIHISTNDCLYAVTLISGCEDTN